MTGYLPLAGINILDLSRGGGAAACVRLLGQLGAGTDCATVGREGPSMRGRQHELVVTDLQPHEGRSLGVDARGPVPGHNGVTVSVTPFGLDGPAADRSIGRSLLEGIEPTLLAALTGAHAAVAALAAIRNWRRHGRSALVEVATIEVIASCTGDLLPPAICDRRKASQPAERTMASRLEVLRCADGWVGISAPTPEDRALLEGMVAGDAEHEDAAGFHEVLRGWLRQRTRQEVFDTAQLWRLPCVPVLEPAEVLKDEQCEARGVWRREADKVTAASPFRYECATVGEESVERSAARPSWPRAGETPALPAGMRSLSEAAATRHSGIYVAGPSARPADGLPLDDVRVLDLGMVWAGPYCGRLLASLGAQVAKVEGPSRRDGTRPASEQGCSGVFGDLNAGKASLVLDLRHDGGRDAFLRLAGEADLVIENFSPRVMPNLGLDFGTMQRRNPRLLMLSMPAFGASGPWANHVAYGGGLELATGLAEWDSHRQPHSAPVAYLDYLAGAYGATGVLAALLARDRTRQGVHLELAQREVACQLLEARREDAPSPATPPPCQGEGRATFSVSVQALARDAHLRERGIFAREDGATHPCRHLARPPWRIEGAGDGAHRSAPYFGSDSRWLLRGWAGLRSDEIDRLVEAGVVAVHKRLRRAA